MTHTNGTARPAKDRPSGLGERVFTSGMVARLCGVSPRTVTKWIDSGRLPGYRIPDCEDRRVRRAELAAFMAEHGLPVPAELLPPMTLYVGCGVADGAAVVRAETILEAAALAAVHHPAAVVIDVGEIGATAALELCRYFQGTPTTVIPTEDDAAAPAFAALGCRVVPPGGEG